MGMRRSSGSQAELLGELEDRAAGDALEDRAGELGGDEAAVPGDEEEVHATELLDVGVRRGVEEDRLVAAVLDALELARERAA